MRGFCVGDDVFLDLGAIYTVFFFFFEIIH